MNVRVSHPSPTIAATDPGTRWPTVLPALLVLGYLLGSATGFAQETASLLGPADTSSPRATLKSFIDSCNQLHSIIEDSRYFDRSSSKHRPLIMRILDCLDVSDLPDYRREETASEVACCLKEILDRTELPPLEEIPDAEMIEAAGGSEKLRQWQIPGTRLSIGRVEQGPRRLEYLFTPGTVSRALEYYQDVKSLPYRSEGEKVSSGFYEWYVSAPGNAMVATVIDRLPDWTRQRVWGVAWWKWGGLGLALLVALLLLVAAYRLQSALASRLRERNLFLYLLTIVVPIFVVFIPLGLKYFTFEYLTLRGTPSYVVGFVSTIVSLLLSISVVIALNNRITAVILASPRINPKGLDAQFVRLMSRLVSIVAAVVIFLEGGRYLGIPVTTLLASAGVGGLAVALAAQDMLKNLFGTIMLLMDKPFRVGERIVFGRYDGVVEDIGLRSTKLRLLTGHQATIPNDELARTDIENIGRRPYIRRTAMIEIPSSTPVVKVKRALEIVRNTLNQHEGMHDEYPPRVFLRDFKESSIGIFVVYWYHESNYWEFLEVSERVNLQIMEQFEAEEIRFATPVLAVQTSERQEKLPE